MKIIWLFLNVQSSAVYNVLKFRLSIGTHSTKTQEVPGCGNTTILKRKRTVCYYLPMKNKSLSPEE
jgi:hypothetical protein